MLAATATEVARTVAIPVNRVRWEEDVPNIGWGLVVHTPWARVLVGRTSSQAERFVRDYQDQKGVGLALLGALVQQYPHEVMNWTDARGLSETPLPDTDLRSFITWAIPRAGTIGWPVVPGIHVLGAWATYPDAILLVRSDKTGSWEYQLRLAAWRRR